MKPISLDQARAAKEAALEMFSTCASVVGVGITRVQDKYAVKINLSEQLPPGTQVPAMIAGVPVRVEVTGIAQARVGSI